MVAGLGLPVRNAHIFGLVVDGLEQAVLGPLSVLEILFEDEEHLAGLATTQALCDLCERDVHSVTDHLLCKRAGACTTCGPKVGQTAACGTASLDLVTRLVGAVLFLLARVGGA